MEKKNNDILKKHSKEIAYGIIIWGICSIIEKVISNAPKTGRTIFGTIQNFIYSCASKISLNSCINLFISFLIGVLAAIAIIPLLSRHINKKYQMKEKEIKKRITNIKKETDKDNKQEKIIDYLDSEVEAIDKKVNRSGKLLMITVIIYILFVVLTMIIPMNLLNSFEYNIKMIKPYTDNKTVMMLESDWTRMRSKNDYDKIYDTINQIKEENNLPKK